MSATMAQQSVTGAVSCEASKRSTSSGHVKYRNACVIGQLPQLGNLTNRMECEWLPLQVLGASRLLSEAECLRASTITGPNINHCKMTFPIGLFVPLVSKYLSKTLLVISIKDSSI